MAKNLSFFRTEVSLNFINFKAPPRFQSRHHLIITLHIKTVFLCPAKISFINCVAVKIDKGQQKQQSTNQKVD